MKHLGVQEIQVIKRGKPAIPPDPDVIANFKNHENEVVMVIAELRDSGKDDAWFIVGISPNQEEIAQVSQVTESELTSLTETLAIMRDKDFMESIRKGSEDVKHGRTHKFDQLLRKHGLG